MNAEEYDKMAEQEKNYWWHRGRRLIIETIIQKFISHKQLEVIDIGCGTGGNFEILKKIGSVTGVDMADAALEYCKSRNVYNVLIKSGADNLPKNKYDLITAFDVLEHIEHDTQTLSTWSQAVKPHGYILLTVPAYQWLFGPHDRALHHKRRYTKKELASKIKDAGFTPVFISYFFFFTFPLLFLSRVISKLNKPKSEKASYQKIPKSIELMLMCGSRIESFFFKKNYSLPFGSSIIAFAKKN